MTSLDQTTLLTADKLAEIKAKLERAHAEIGQVCAEGPQRRFRMSIPANPDRDTDLIVSDALKGAEDLVAEVDRLNAAMTDLEGQNALTEAFFTDHVADAARDKDALTAQVEAAKLVVARLSSELDQARESAKHMGDALTKVGTVMQAAARTAVELGAHAGMDVIIGYLSDAGMLPSAVQADPQDGETP